MLLVESNAEGGGGGNNLGVECFIGEERFCVVFVGSGCEKPEKCPEDDDDDEFIDESELAE
jgi:hypothetical protein